MLLQLGSVARKAHAVAEAGAERRRPAAEAARCLGGRVESGRALLTCGSSPAIHCSLPSATVACRGGCAPSGWLLQSSSVEPYAAQPPTSSSGSASRSIQYIYAFICLGSIERQTRSFVAKLARRRSGCRIRSSAVHAGCSASAAHRWSASRRSRQKNHPGQGRVRHRASARGSAPRRRWRTRRQR
jgi:hypothetical protein